MSADAHPDFDAAGPWRLSPEVSLRPESFGALAYHHGTRRLVFLKSGRLVTLVSRLDEFASAQEALDALVDTPARERYRRALGSLAAGGLIRAR